MQLWATCQSHCWLKSSTHSVPSAASDFGAQLHLCCACTVTTSTTHGCPLCPPHMTPADHSCVSPLPPLRRTKGRWGLLISACFTCNNLEHFAHPKVLLFTLASVWIRKTEQSLKKKMCHCQTVSINALTKNEFRVLPHFFLQNLVWFSSLPLRLASHPLKIK